MVSLRLLLFVSALALAIVHANAGVAESLVRQQHKQTNTQGTNAGRPGRQRMRYTNVYWNFGGSTVMTKNIIRLTPSTQDRRGWLWNEYPLESINWEVEFKCEVFSKPHFGGDGFAFWVLAGEQDPSFTQNPDAIGGPLFGMKNDYKGFGVVFDVYDNDNRRNNPSIFVVSNPTGKMTSYNHDNDYEDDRVKALPDNVAVGTSGASSSCVADIRNSGKVSKILVKYLHRILHVYVDTSEGNGYKFCLAVKLEDDFKDHHLAFTAATGQVADNHDIIEITTRYLKQSDRDFDDSSIGALHGGGSHHSSWYTLYWLVQGSLSGAVLGLAGFQLYLFHTLSQARIDMVQICNRINPNVLPHYGLHALLTIFFLMGGNYYVFLLHAPLLAWRIFEFVKKNFLFSPNNIGPSKGHGGSSKAVYLKLGLPSILYGVCLLWALFKIFFG